VITAGCPNPEKALSAGTTPNKTSEAKHMSVTASYSHLPQISKPIRTAKVVARMV
jgi:hypothetical protein